MRRVRHHPPGPVRRGPRRQGAVRWRAGARAAAAAGGQARRRAVELEQAAPRHDRAARGHGLRRGHAARPRGHARRAPGDVRGHVGRPRAGRARGAGAPAPLLDGVGRARRPGPAGLRLRQRRRRRGLSCVLRRGAGARRGGRLPPRAAASRDAARRAAGVDADARVRRRPGGARGAGPAAGGREPGPRAARRPRVADARPVMRALRDAARGAAHPVGKPHPATYEEALRRCAPAGRVLAVGDSMAPTSPARTARASTRRSVWGIHAADVGVAPGSAAVPLDAARLAAFLAAFEPRDRPTLVLPGLRVSSVGENLLCAFGRSSPPLCFESRRPRRPGG